jgi:glycosyltransferase involved in cell wall biosynthesis
MTVSSLVNPLLSVVVPIGSRQGDISLLSDWVPIAVAREIEVILVHDFHDIKTKLALEKLVEKINSQKIKFLEGKFGSPGEARNFGIPQASGKWICFWDSDDQPDITRFLNMVNQAESIGSTACVGNFEKLNVITEDVSKIRLSSNKLLLEMQIAKDPGLWRFAFDRNLVKDVNFEKFRMGEDQSYLAKALLLCDSIQVSKDFVYQYVMGSKLQLTQQKSAVMEIWNFISLCETQKKMKNSSRFHLFIYSKQVLSLSLVQRELGFAKAFSKLVSFSGLRIGYTFLFLIFLFFTLFQNRRYCRKND